MEWLEELLKSGKIDESVKSEIAKHFEEVVKEANEYKSKYEELSKSYQEVVSSKEKFENELKTLEEKINKAKEEGKKELVSELEKEKSEKEELLNRLKELESKNKELTINTELSKVLDEVGVVDKEIAALALKHFVDISEDGKVVFKNGEEVLDLSEGAKKFFESKPHLLKANGTGGSGAGGSGSGAVKKRSEMSLEEKASYIAEYGKEAYEKLPE